MAVVRILPVDPGLAGPGADAVAESAGRGRRETPREARAVPRNGVAQQTVSQRSTSQQTVSHGSVTQMLRRIHHGDDEALAQAVTAVYQDLQRIASRRLAGERRTPTFDTESLIHEVYVQLARQDRTQWRNRDHFFAIATRIMRRILVDRARRRGYVKRGGQARLTTFDGKQLTAESRPLDVVTLDDALTDLAHHDPRLAQIVELRFFGGLTNPEIASIQGVTSMTVIRRWRLARAWLHRYLTQEAREGTQ